MTTLEFKLQMELWPTVRVFSALNPDVTLGAYTSLKRARADAEVHAHAHGWKMGVAPVYGSEFDRVWYDPDYGTWHK